MAYYKSGGINVTSNSNVSINTASGSIASFNTNLSMPVLETKATINPIQNGTPWIDSNIVNKEPYIKRAVVGTATRIGNHLYDKLVGGTVAWNQLCNATAGSYSAGDVTFTKNNDGSYTLTGIPNNANTFYNLDANNHEGSYIILNHVYLLPKGNSYNGNIGLGLFGENTDRYSITRDIIFKAVGHKYESSWMRIQISNLSGVDIGTVKIFPQLYDLTQMFGSTIADYIYSLEQATAGAGVAWFRALFPNDYYAYNAGELMSVKATAHVMKNASNQVIGNYALDSNLELRGIPKLDSNNKLYYDGDTYESSGLVTRKMKEFNIYTSQLPINSDSVNSNGIIRFICNTTDKKMGVSNVVCSAFATASSIILVNTSNEGISGYASGTSIYVAIFASKLSGDLSTPEGRATAFKNWCNNNNVKMYYEMNTPTTEQASPFTNPQVCDENGTEEYTDSRAVAIPVGHETYQANICPISGHSSANITRCGVNLWDEEWELGYYNTANGQPLPISDRIRSKNFIPITPETAFRLVIANSNYIMPLFYDKDKNYLGYITNGVYSGYQNPFTSLANACYMTFYVSPSYGTTYNNDISINYPATDTTYHAYNGQTYAIAFGQTVYGCVLNVTRGKLTITHTSFDMGDVYWAREEDTKNPGIYYFRYLTNPLAKQGSICNCSCYETYMGTGAIPDLNLKVSGAGQYVFIRARDDNYTSEVAFRAAVTGQRVVYPLATPFDIDLTPVQINSLLGVNNVWHDDNGDTEVKYRKVNT